MRRKPLLFVVLVSLLSVAWVGQTMAGEVSKAKRKLVIQVSTSDPKVQGIAMNNAVNVQKSYGMDNIDIEIVAYGPGLSMLTAKNKAAIRVKSLAAQNITFSACGNTMKKIEKKTGKKPILTQGVKVVPGGVVRIMELQSQGYAYIRP